MEDSPFLYVPNSLSTSGGNYNVFFHVKTLWVVIVEFLLMVKIIKTKHYIFNLAVKNIMNIKLIINLI